MITQDYCLHHRVLHYIRFGSLDRVFPLLRSVFYGKSLSGKINDLSMRMQLLLWHNFTNCVSSNSAAAIDIFASKKVEGNTMGINN